MMRAKRTLSRQAARTSGRDCVEAGRSGRVTGVLARLARWIPITCVAVAAATASPAHADDAPAAAFGSAFVTWIAVSPAYQHTGTAVAVAATMQCSKDCTALWVTHDGGASWRRAAGHNWNPSRVAIAADKNLHEIFFTASSNSLLRSDDDGDTWTAAGTGGMPTVLPTYATTRSVVVAAAGGPNDYLLDNITPSEVAGSNGAVQDLAFTVSPTFPNGGSYSPALLVGVDAKSKQPVVLRCTAAFACSHGTPLQLSVQPSSFTSLATLLYVASDYPQSGVVFANTPMGIQKSTDGGATFTQLNVAPAPKAAANATPMMALAPDYRESGPVRTAYVAVFQAYDPQSQTSGHTEGGIYRTTDGGRTWAPLATTGLFAGGSQAVATAPDGRIFASYYDGTGHSGLLCSTDGGTTWKASCPPAGDHPVSAAAHATPCANCHGSQANGSSGSGSSGTQNGSSSSGNNSGNTGSGGSGRADAVGVSAHTTTPRAGWAFVVGGLAVVLALAAGVQRLRRRRTRVDEA
jgi:photosystem II stability/assembly factor-like uncharacterized protein